MQSIYHMILLMLLCFFLFVLYVSKCIPRAWTVGREVSMTLAMLVLNDACESSTQVEEQIASCTQTERLALL